MSYSTIIYIYQYHHSLSHIPSEDVIHKKERTIKIFDSWTFTKFSRKKGKVPKRFDLVPQALLTCQSLGNRSSCEKKKCWTKKMENMSNLTLTSKTYISNIYLRRIWEKKSSDDTVWPKSSFLSLWIINRVLFYWCPYLLKRDPQSFKVRSFLGTHYWTLNTWTGILLLA